MCRQYYYTLPFQSISRTPRSNINISYNKQQIPSLIHCLHSYIKSFHICQLTHIDKPPMRQLQTRINLSYRPLSRLTMDLKVMPKSDKGHEFILCVIDGVTHYLITVPITSV